MQRQEMFDLKPTKTPPSEIDRKAVPPFSTPCASITRIRFKGYVLSSRGEHPCFLHFLKDNGSPPGSSRKGRGTPS